MSISAHNFHVTSIRQDEEASPEVLRKVLTASFIGNFVEWFDYASYGYFATVIAIAFFPEIAPSAALLATFAVFAISFVVRPIGGIVWGAPQGLYAKPR